MSLVTRHASALTLFSLSAFAATPAAAHHTETHFEDASTHKVVYQFNHADPGYQEHVLFSVGAVLRTYGDDVEIVVEVFGEGIHLLAKKPQRPVADTLREKAASLAAYGVRFNACQNTMDSMKWGPEDMLDFANVVPSGAVDLMLLQEQGFAYVSW